MRRRPHPSRPPAPRPDDRELERQLTALRADYRSIAPDCTFVARVHEQITALTRPLRIRKRRRALGFAASVLVAFVAGFLGAGGASFWGHGGASPGTTARVLSSGGDASPPISPLPGAALSKVPDPRTTAERLRVLLAPVGTPAALDPATIAAWKKATRDPDPTLRAVARALLRASGTPLDAGPRVSPNAALIDLDVPDDLPGGDETAPPEPGHPTDDAAPPPPDDVPRDPPRAPHSPPRRASSARKPPLPPEAPR